MMGLVAFDLTLPQLAIVAAFIVIAPVVAYFVLRSHKQIFGCRAVYQDFARHIGVAWTPPKNPDDRMGPGRVKGRYRDRKLTLDSTTPVGAGRNRLPETVIRIGFSRSLGLGINGGSGTFRARKPSELTLADSRLRKALRVKTNDRAGAERLLNQPGVAQALLTLDQRSARLSIDDGSLACVVPLPASTAELQAHVDALVATAAAVDQGAQGAQGAQ